MTKRRYKFTVTDIDALAAAYPHAIEETIIPQRIERKVSYAYIAKLLDLNLPVAGIQIESDIPPALRGLTERDMPKGAA